MTRSATMLSRAEAYLAYRRSLGFKLKIPGRQITSFAKYADDRGHEGALSSDIALRWAKAGAKVADPFTWAKRLEVLRPFAAFLAAEDGGTTFQATNPFVAQSVGSHRTSSRWRRSRRSSKRRIIFAAFRLPGRL